MLKKIHWWSITLPKYLQKMIFVVALVSGHHFLFECINVCMYDAVRARDKQSLLRRPWPYHPIAQFRVIDNLESNVKRVHQCRTPHAHSTVVQLASAALTNRTFPARNLVSYTYIEHRSGSDPDAHHQEYKALPCGSQGQTHLFCTCENFRPRSLKVRSPGHLKWPHLRKSLSACHIYTDWMIALKPSAIG